MLIIDILEEDISVMTNPYEELQRATAVSDTEVRISRANVMAKTPAWAVEFILMLKRFTNLLHALFTSQYPLDKKMYGIIKEFRDYYHNARSQL